SEYGRSILHGGAGNDHLDAGNFVSELYGGDGNDTDKLVGGGLKSHLYGGGGSDWYSVTNNSFAIDAAVGDVVTWGNFHLTGGVQQWWHEADEWHYRAPFSSLLTATPFAALMQGPIFAKFVEIDAPIMTSARFGITDEGQLIIQSARGRGGQAVIENWGEHADYQNAKFAGNIAVVKQVIEEGKQTRAELEQYVSLVRKASFGVGLDGTDPLVLDLDGDGIELIRRDSGLIYFDIDADGFGERTSWVRRDDGLLVRDLNGNGTIDDISEVFGNETTAGFAELATLDSNGDGVIDQNDPGFADLLIWRDLNEDGITDPGELFTLGELGITSFSLSTTAPDDTSIRDSEIQAEGHFTRADGSTGTIADIVLSNSQTDTKFLGDPTVSATAALLPELTGSGELTDLRVAMTSDATLLSLVDTFANQSAASTWQTYEQGTLDILYRWADVEAVPGTELTDALTERDVALLEAAPANEVASGPCATSLIVWLSTNAANVSSSSLRLIGIIAPFASRCTRS
ncbi:MAG: hypothetical protein AAFR70_14955, partial [Pseudomonadota bacterium]